MFNIKGWSELQFVITSYGNFKMRYYDVVYVSCLKSRL
jgi:hypothetical protein